MWDSQVGGEAPTGAGGTAGSSGHVLVTSQCGTRGLPGVLARLRVGPPLTRPAPAAGLTQYSGDPQTEWDLSTFGAKEDVLAAVRSLRYKGGNTFTGLPGPPAAPPRGFLFSGLRPAGQPPRFGNLHADPPKCYVGAELESHLCKKQISPC